MKTDLIEYGVTDAALLKLKEKHSIVADASTKEGYAEIKLVLSEIRPLRTGIEAKRKELKADALAWGKKVDSEAKRITAELVSIEAPHKDAKQYQDDEAARILREKQEAEQKRIQLIRDEIEAIKSLESGLAGANKSLLEERLKGALSFKEKGDFFQEFKDGANEIIDNIVESLENAIKERELFESEQAEQAEKQRVIDEKQAELDKKQAVLEAKEEEQRIKEREEIAAKEAREKAENEAKEALAEEKAKALARENELKASAEQAKMEAKETEERVMREAAEKLEAEKREAEKREANKKHKAKINNAAVAAMVEGGLPEPSAKKAITLIAQKIVPNVVISY